MCRTLVDEIAKEVGYPCKAQVTIPHCVPEILVIITDCRMHQTIVLDRRGSTPDDQVSPHFPSGSFVPKSTSRETEHEYQ